MYPQTSAAFHDLMGFRLTWLGTKGFLVTKPIPERAKDSSHLFPSTVIVPSEYVPDIRSVTGPSLQTLQHHLKSLAGGPKESTLSQKPLPPRAVWTFSLFFSAKDLTYSRVSGNSRPVSMLMSSSPSAACDARP